LEKLFLFDLRTLQFFDSSTHKRFVKRQSICVDSLCDLVSREKSKIVESTNAYVSVLDRTDATMNAQNGQTGDESAANAFDRTNFPFVGRVVVHGNDDEIELRLVFAAGGSSSHEFTDAKAAHDECKNPSGTTRNRPVLVAQ
jgi:hypothetical protein